MPPPNSRPECAVVIPNWNGARWLPRCLAALQRQTLPPVEVLVVDNGSTDESLALLAGAFPQVRVTALGTNIGFAAAVNRGIAATRAPLVALLNTDTEAEPAWLETLATSLADADERVGAAVGLFCLMEDPLRVENAGDLLSWQGVAEKRGYGQPIQQFLESGEVFSCCAGGALYRRTFLDAVGPFDESFFAYWEDIDLGLRGRLLGYRYQYVPSARLLHQGHGSGLPTARYVRLATANRWRVFFKNMPADLLLRHAGSLLYGQFYFMACQRRPLAALAGVYDFLRTLPATLHARHALAGKRALSIEEIDRLLARRMQARGLLALARARLRGEGA